MNDRATTGALFLLFLLFPLLLSLCPSPAAAHSDVDEGKELLMEAEFERALEAFERAARSNDLTREELIELLSARSLVHLALDDAAALRLDLRRLASLDREHRWGREAPPELTQAFADTLTVIEGELSVTSEVNAVPGGIEVRGEAQADHGGLVREVWIHARSRAGSYHRMSRSTQVLPEGERLYYYVVAIGPGNAIVASLGSDDSPLISTPALAGPSLIHQDDGEDGGLSPWLWVGVGAGILVVAGVILAVVLAGSASPDGTQPEAPMVIGF